MTHRLPLLPLLLLLLGGCTVVVFEENTPETGRGLSDRAVILDVPTVFQTEKYDCGLAALTMLFAYYDREVDRRAGADFRKRAAEAEGLTGRELRDYLADQGFDAFVIEGSVDQNEGVSDLYYHLDRGRPVIVALGSDVEEQHYVLVSGYDPVKKLIVLEDPARGALLTAVWKFEAMWKTGGHFALLAVPKAPRGG